MTRDARYYSKVNKVAKTFVDLIEQVVLLAAEYKQRDGYDDLLAALLKYEGFDDDLRRMIADAARTEILKRDDPEAPR
jgi:hypothetical protein